MCCSLATFTNRGEKTKKNGQKETILIRFEEKQHTRTKYVFGLPIGKRRISY